MEGSAAFPAGAAQALGQAMAQKSFTANSTQKKAANETNSSNVTVIQTVWQHPFVDVFKHFKVLPFADWKMNKK